MQILINKEEAFYSIQINVLDYMAYKMVHKSYLQRMAHTSYTKESNELTDLCLMFHFPPDTSELFGLFAQHQSRDQIFPLTCFHEESTFDCLTHG